MQEREDQAEQSPPESPEPEPAERPEPEVPGRFAGIADSIGSLDGRPVEEHHEVFEDAHRQLDAALREIDESSGR